MTTAGGEAPARAAVTRVPTHAPRTLAVAGLAHALHDGYTDVIYVLLPVWQAEFGLGYGRLATLRGLYAGAMAILQIPSGRLAAVLGGRTVLAAGTALAALGYALAGAAGGLLGLSAALAVAGAGGSTQHPIGSGAVSRAYGSAARGPLGVYNFSGDLGKAAVPAVMSLVIAATSWRHALWGLSGLGLVVAAAVLVLMPAVTPEPVHASVTPSAPDRRDGGVGFGLLLAIGVLDTAARMGLLTFLPFLLQAKGASLATVGLGLGLVFLGGAAGKAACGWLGARLGLLRTVLLTEGGTAALILAVLALPLWPALAVLPLLGTMLNGTSSVLYGTVPELRTGARAESAFAVFYTGVIGAGAIAPVGFGYLGDATGPGWATVATAVAALATLPLAMLLAPRLSVARRGPGMH
ncbi:MAG TPA: MFS transporter [Myxococcaceae bacterium]|nr:MFS transporter [Myxococcaceae bacterium]